jgi:hypothetical protein
LGIEKIVLRKDRFPFFGSVIDEFRFIRERKKADSLVQSTKCFVEDGSLEEVEGAFFFEFKVTEAGKFVAFRALEVGFNLGEGEHGDSRRKDKDSRIEIFVVC